RRVDGDVREAVPLEERERVCSLILLDPGAVAELDERDERVEERRDRLQLLHRLLRLREARRVLEEDAAQLAGVLEWCQRVPELGERLLAVGLLVAGHPFACLRVE